VAGPARADVLIAGGGPVGLVLALELGRRGVPCIVLNDRPTTAEHPKANAIGSRTMEHFRRLGTAAPIRASGLDDDHPTDVAYFTRLTGYELARLRLPSRAEALRQSRAGDGPWANSPEPPHRCSQIFLERELFRRCAAFPSIDLRFGWRLESFAETADGITARAAETEGQGRLDIVARYMVGADGGASVVRKSLGIEYEGESGVVRPFMGGSMYAAYIRARRDRSWLSVGPSWQYWVVNPEIRAIFIHVDSNEHFLAHTAIPPGKDASGMDTRAFVQRLANASVPLDVISVVPWTAGYALVAQKFGKGRSFIAGDSAHLFTPTGGLGMNTGVEDAVNLGWKLAAVCRGWGGANLLASYETERRAYGIKNVNYARGFATSVGTVPVTAEIERDTAEGKAERATVGARLADHAYREFVIPGIQLGVCYDDSPIVAPDGTAPPPFEPTRYTPFATPGARAPHVWLGEGRALFDALGLDFTLLRLGGTRTDTSALERAAAPRGVPLAVLDVPGERARDYYARDLALIRPDHYVAWRGDALPADCLALVDRARGALH
jgi:2-polyprenyl-6-methoxyphenol hydroxylase-like FAD-dependent oxidoreductase